MRKEDKFLTISEAAQFLKVSKTSLRRWSNEGRLRCYRIGNRGERRFLQNDLLVFINGANLLENSVGSPVTRAQRDRQGLWLESRAPCHLCTMFRGEDEQWQLIRACVLEHLMPEAQTVYAYYGDPERILERLADEGINGQSMVSKGRLRMVSCSDSYLRDGYFDPDQMLERVREAITGFSTAGIRKLLLIGEMEWCSKGFPGSERVIEYEKAIDGILSDYPWVTVICQYSLAKMPAATIFDSLCVHSYLHTANGTVTGLNLREIT